MPRSQSSLGLLLTQRHLFFFSSSRAAFFFLFFLLKTTHGDPETAGESSEVTKLPQVGPDETSSPYSTAREIPLPLPSTLQPEKNSGKRKDGRKEDKKLRKEGRKRGREREGRRKGREEKGRKKDRETEKGDQIPLYFPDIFLAFLS